MNLYVNIPIRVTKYNLVFFLFIDVNICVISAILGGKFNMKKLSGLLFYIPPLVMLFMIVLLLISLVSFKKFDIKKKLKYLIIIEIFSFTVGYLIVFNNVRWNITNKYANLNTLSLRYDMKENGMNVDYIGFKGVEELYEIGELDPDQIHTPGIYVQHLVVGKQEKRIERLTVSR